MKRVEDLTFPTLSIQWAYGEMQYYTSVFNKFTSNEDCVFVRFFYAFIKKLKATGLFSWLEQSPLASHGTLPYYHVICSARFHLPTLSVKGNGYL
jgi:hypothetical protein